MEQEIQKRIQINSQIGGLRKESEECLRAGDPENRHPKNISNRSIELLKNLALRVKTAKTKGGKQGLF